MNLNNSDNTDVKKKDEEAPNDPQIPVVENTPINTLLQSQNSATFG